MAEVREALVLISERIGVLVGGDWAEHVNPLILTVRKRAIF